MALLVFIFFVYGVVQFAKKEIGGGPSSVRGSSGRSGLSDYLSEAWHGFWEQQARSLSAARAAKPVDGRSKVRWRDRFATGRRTFTSGTVRVRDGARRVRQRVADSPLVRPVGEPRRGANPAVPDVEPAPDPTPPDQPNPEPSTPPAGDTTMTAPAGTSAGHAAEANNYEAALRKLNELGGRVDSQSDRAVGAKNYLDRVDDTIDAIEQEQRRLATETQQMTEALTAVHLDPSTLAGMSAVNEALDPNALAECLQFVEALKAAMQRVISGCDTARGAISATRQQIMARYGDAHDVVNTHLSGDASFLQGEAGNAAAPTPKPTPQPATAGRHAA